MRTDQLESQYDAVAEEIDSSWDEQGSAEFGEALSRLVVIADDGSIEAAEFLGEILALDGPRHDAEAAYIWYYIALSQQDYTVEFQDTNNAPPNYCGPVGDFRNESMVSGLVEELGFDRVRELDKQATLKLAKVRRD